jgi:hypothetical protein
VEGDGSPDRTVSGGGAVDVEPWGRAEVKPQVTVERAPSAVQSAVRVVRTAGVEGRFAAPGTVKPMSRRSSGR